MAIQDGFYQLEIVAYSERRSLLVSIGENMRVRFLQTLHELYKGSVPSEASSDVYTIVGESSVEDRQVYKLKVTIFFILNESGEANAESAVNWFMTLFPWLESLDEEELTHVKLSELENGEVKDVIQLYELPYGTDPGSGEDADDWVQPTGAHNAYPIDSIVKFRGKRYKSSIAANVWAPDVYGWELVQQGNGNGEYEDWIQPTGAHDAYEAGSIVRHNGLLWVNVHGDGNVWEPGEFGWEEYDAGT